MLLYTEDDWKGSGVTRVSWTRVWFVLYVTPQQKPFKFHHLYNSCLLGIQIGKSKSWRSETGVTEGSLNHLSCIREV